MAIKDMLEAGGIGHSASLWSLLIGVVENKKDGHRFCVDFRVLHNIFKPLAYPLPLIDDILALLGNATYFAYFDWQLVLDKADWGWELRTSCGSISV